ncbi:MAG: hypothetical protein SGILL_008891, partial [Bacillariaceae sp.]
VFHQSLVLILENNEEITSGVVLNRPSTKSVEIAGATLPLRFGGRFGVKGKKTDKPELWLHCNNRDLQDAKVGEPISDYEDGSIVWKCSRVDAESALAVGLAKPEDFVVVEGLSVWNKSPSVTRGHQSPVEIDACFSEVHDVGIDIVWKLLSSQEPLNKKNAAENLEAANAAWMIGSGNLGAGSVFQTMEQQHVQSLASNALDRWIRLFLLKKP